MTNTWFLIALIGISVREISSWKSLCGNTGPKLVDSTERGRGTVKYPSGEDNAKSWIVRVNRGEEFNIHVNVTDFVLEGHFLVIKEEDIDLTSVRSEIQLVSGTSSEDGFRFKIPMSKSFYMEICQEVTEKRGPDVPGHFTVTYLRNVPVFEDPLPDDHPEKQKERESHEVQFKGKSPEAFRSEDFLLRFKEAVARIAQEYCKRNNITFDESKTPNEMVTVYVIHECPAEWYDRHLCASVHHSVYASGDDMRVTKHIWNYELTRVHLKEMWEQPYTNQFLEDLHLRMYELPDSTIVFGWWFLFFFVPVALLVFVSLAIYKIYKYFAQDFIMSHSITTDGALTYESRKKSKLRINEHQVVPPFMTEEVTTASKTRQGNSSESDEQKEQKDYCAALLFPRFRFE